MAKEDLTLRATAGRPAFEFNALRLFTDITVPAGSTVCGLDRQSQKTVYGPQYGRLTAHSKFRPWVLVAYFAFVSEKRAIAFEKYLKSGSGRAFAKRHFH
jgi:hypothetical protein